MLKKVVYTTILLLAVVNCMEMDDNDSYTRPEIVDAGSKTFHWLCSVFLLLVLPSISTCLSFGDKLHSSIFLQTISVIYSVLEALILRFPDSDGVENRTSRGCAWFLLIIMSVTLFIGSIASGTGFLVRSKKLQSIISHTGERQLSIAHRVLSVSYTHLDVYKRQI